MYEEWNTSCDPCKILILSLLKENDSNKKTSRRIIKNEYLNKLITTDSNKDLPPKRNLHMTKTLKTQEYTDNDLMLNNNDYSTQRNKRTVDNSSANIPTYLLPIFMIKKDTTLKLDDNANNCQFTLREINEVILYYYSFLSLKNMIPMTQEAK